MSEEIKAKKDKKDKKKRRCKCGCKKLFLPLYPRQLYVDPTHNPKSQKKEPKEVICGFCHDQFPTTRKNQRYCNERCRKNAWRRDNPEVYMTVTQYKKQQEANNVQSNISSKV